ncbi:MAG: hypothetical protein AABW51_03725 [Nanoarchaeota archaeon]
MKEETKRHGRNVVFSIAISLIIYLILNLTKASTESWSLLTVIILLLVYFELLDQRQR